MSHSITALQHNTCGATRSIQRQHSCVLKIHCRYVEGFEHDLNRFLAIRFRIEWRLGRQHWMFLWSHSQFVVERVMPDLLHVVPVRHNGMFNRTLESEDTTLRLRLVTDV